MMLLSLFSAMSADDSFMVNYIHEVYSCVNIWYDYSPSNVFILAVQMLFVILDCSVISQFMSGHSVCWWFGVSDFPAPNPAFNRGRQIVSFWFQITCLCQSIKINNKHIKDQCIVISLGADVLASNDPPLWNNWNGHLHFYSTLLAAFLLFCIYFQVSDLTI